LTAPGLVTRHWTVLGFRLATILCLAAAVANPVASLPSDTLDVVFAADVSGSVSRLAPGAESAWIASALKSRSLGDQAGLVVFGKNPLNATPLGAADIDLSSVDNPPPQTRPGGFGGLDDGASNIGQAISFADGQLWRHRGRIVLLSDGQENTGNAVDAARIARQSGLQVDVVPVAISSPEVAAEGLTAPNKVRENEWFSFTLSVQSNVNTTAHVQVLADGQPASTQSVSVHPGANDFVFGQAPLGHGYHTMTAVVDAQNDTIAENNRVDSAVEVLGAPHILLAEGAADD